MMNAAVEYYTEAPRYRAVRQSTGPGTTIDPAGPKSAKAQTAHERLTPILLQGVLAVGQHAAALVNARRQVVRVATDGVVLSLHASARSNSAFPRKDTLSAFAELDALRSDDSVIQAVLTSLRHASTLPYKDRLAARLEHLLSAYKEDTDGRVFSVDSLRGLIAFLENANSLRYPSVTLTPSGDLYASWKQGRDHVFDAHFLRSQQVRFVIFRPNVHNVGQSDQLSGVTTPQSLPGMIAHLNVDEWAAA